MKLRISMVILVVLLLLAAPTATADRPQPVGEQINVFIGTPDTFPADTPFHIMHGWASDPPEARPYGLYDFVLEVDGIPWDEDFVLRSFDPDLEYPLVQRWVHNFPNGMTGEVTFTGHWFAACRVAIDLGYQGECRTPNEVVETFSNSLTVTFD